VLPTVSTSGALGTYVELISARGPELTPGYTFTVRSVTDTSVIDITAQGPAAGVQKALVNLMADRQNEAALLRNLFKLAILQTPSAVVAAGSSNAKILAAAVALALLAGLGVLLVLGRLLPTAPTEPRRRHEVSYVDHAQLHMEQAQEPHESQRLLGELASTAPEPGEQPPR
jgi:hypothetical protein